MLTHRAASAVDILLLRARRADLQDEGYIPCSHWTPLLWASCNGNLDCVNVLLEFKASHIYIDPERLKQHVRHSNGSFGGAPP